MNKIVAFVAISIFAYAPVNTSGAADTGFVLTPNLPLKAFPSAEGFGADTRGGRGGKVIEVTNLNDSGPGSLREAIQSPGRRIVVFRVGGTIELAKSIYIFGKNSYLTIAGQTAPGDGIQLKNYGFEFLKGAHDVVIRHLRIRPGLSSGSGSVDAVTIYDKAGTHIHHIVFDHVTMEWAIDENAGHGGWVTDVTYQWCIFAEGATEADPGGSGGWWDGLSKGMLVAGDQAFPSNVSVHHSLFAHNTVRNPLVKGAALADFRNNLVYNWGRWTHSATQVMGTARVNVVNNHYIRGIDSLQDIVIRPYDDAKIYVTGNISPRCPTGCIDPWDVGIKDSSSSGDYKRDIP
ncbi:MAG: hypothetical protein E4H01_13020, partial [Lysobacterales bacterium]